ncbi:hypothetical protein ACFLXU_04915 [Chloroflexota bacterium]
MTVIMAKRGTGLIDMDLKDITAETFFVKTADIVLKYADAQGAA